MGHNVAEGVKVQQCEKASTIINKLIRIIMYFHLLMKVSNYTVAFNHYNLLLFSRFKIVYELYWDNFTKS